MLNMAKVKKYTHLGFVYVSESFVSSMALYDG